MPATVEPMPPSPMMPHATAGELAVPSPLAHAQLPALTSLSSWPTRRMSSNRRAKVCSGHGVIAIMFGVADADLQLARLIEIEVAGDAGTAEHDALDVPLPADGAQQIVRNVVAAHQQGVGILQTLRLWSPRRT